MSYKVSNSGLIPAFSKGNAGNEFYYVPDCGSSVCSFTACKSSCTGNLEFSFSPSVPFTLFSGRVMQCQLPAPKQTSCLLNILLNTY